MSELQPPQIPHRPQGPIERIDGIDKGITNVRAFDEEIMDGEGRAPYHIQEDAAPETVLAIGAVITERRQRIQAVVEILEERRADLEDIVPKLLEHDVKFAPINDAFKKGFVSPRLYGKLCQAYDASVAAIMASIPYSIHNETRRVLPSTLAAPATADVPVNTAPTGTTEIPGEPTESSPGTQPEDLDIQWFFDPKTRKLQFADEAVNDQPAVILNALLQRAGTGELMSNTAIAELLFRDLDLPADRRQMAVVRAQMTVLKQSIGEALQRQGLMIISPRMPYAAGQTKGAPPVGHCIARIPAEALDTEGSEKK